MNTTATHNPTRFPLLLLALALAAMILWAAPRLADVDRVSISHAVEHHGETDVELINRCLDEHGPEETWFNPKTDTWAQCVKLDDTGRDWGVDIVKQIEGYFKRTTAFRAQETWLDELERYLINRGFMQIP